MRLSSGAYCHPSLIVIQRSIATKDLNTSTNSPLERGRGVLECIRFVCLTHPLPLSRGEKVYALEILRFALNDKMKVVFRFDTPQ